ncbi:MAG: sulfotransferase domain-containing protein [Alteromonadaceae bacterium]|nr:sulfotransferase domain-containing protein [Alteromonadaceae bacterium]
MKSLAIEALKKSVVFPVRNTFLQLNRKAGHFSNVVWLIGDGRSGTTWISSVINSRSKARELFEPYHPLVHNNPSLAPYLYSTRDTLPQDLISTYKSIFSGKLLHRRIDFDNRNLLYNGLIVKDIFINLAAHSLSQLFPSVKTVLLIRNPFAVVASKIQKKHWYWPTDLGVYINNASLMKRLGRDTQKYLIDAQRRNNFAEIQFIHWAIGNLIVLEDFTEETLHLLFYEDMKDSPNAELGKLNNYLGENFDFIARSASEKTLSKPSRVVYDTKRIEHEYSMKYWERTFSREDFTAGVQALKYFDMFNLYGEDGKPNHEQFIRFGFNL